MAGIICIIIAYLLGSINTSILLSKIMKFPDPRTGGSGSAGATNVLRTIGKNQAAIVLIGDIIKGLLAVWIGRIFGVYGFMLGLVAFAAVVGHVFPVFFKFKGGKGVATGFGAILALSLWAGILALAVWVAVAFFFRYSSLASLAATVSAPIFLLIFGKFTFVIPAILIALLIIWKHLPNIDRLRAGTESKINLKK